MKVDQVIEFFGSKANTAKALSITYQAVQQWEESGKIPRGRQFEIHIISDGKLIVDELPDKKAA